MAYDPYPKSGLRTWHVVVFLGFVVLVVDIASIQMLGNNNQVQFTTVPTQPGTAQPVPVVPPRDTAKSQLEVAPPPRPIERP